jgi:hypothetical protein
VFELGRIGAGRGLLAADPADPGVDVVERALERVDVQGSSGLRASITSMLTPKRSSKRFQVWSVSGNSTPVSIMNTWASGSISVSMCRSTDSSFWKEQAILSRGWNRSTA